MQINQKPSVSSWLFKNAWIVFRLWWEPKCGSGCKRGGGGGVGGGGGDGVGGDVGACGGGVGYGDSQRLTVVFISFA